MKKTVLCLLLVIGLRTWAQDPSFSQFFASPLNINPGQTGNINADWRLISNFRDQWIGPASPYVTGTVSYDRKLGQNRMPGVADDNVWGMGVMLMYDQAMAGVVRSTYGSLNFSYNMKVFEGYVATHRLGIGFGGIWGRRTVDYTRVDFEEQFTGWGFNSNMPTSEAALSNMKGYISLSTGLVYNIKTEKSNFDIGVAGFHLNKPRQTFLENENQYLAMRKVVHANYERYMNERTVFMANAIYQAQSSANYYSFGAAVGYHVGDDRQTVMNLGLWYWGKNAIIPYIGLNYKDFQFGFSYDLTVMKLSEATRKPNTFELSLILRGVKDWNGIIPCPWR